MLFGVSNLIFDLLGLLPSSRLVNILLLLRYDLLFSRWAGAERRVTDILELLVVVVHSFAPFINQIVHNQSLNLLC